MQPQITQKSIRIFHFISLSPHLSDQHPILVSNFQSISAAKHYYATFHHRTTEHYSTGDADDMHLWKKKQEVYIWN